jgi:hypothetical protein
VVVLLLLHQFRSSPQGDALAGESR